MIRKSMPSGYDPMGGYRFSLATNAKRLRGDHAQTKRIVRFSYFRLTDNVKTRHDPNSSPLDHPRGAARIHACRLADLMGGSTDRGRRSPADFLGGPQPFPAVPRGARFRPACRG